MDKNTLSIRSFHSVDYPEVMEIHRQGLAGGNASFLEQPPAWETWDASKLAACRLVAEEEGEIIGWAALAPFSSQCFYAGVVEVSLYVADQAQGRGVGSQLLQALIDCSESQGIWSLQALIFPENEASLNLHRRFGFRDLGLMERPARMPDGRWRDVLILERRSKRAGIE